MNKLVWQLAVFGILFASPSAADDDRDYVNMNPGLRLFILFFLLLAGSIVVAQVPEESGEDSGFYEVQLQWIQGQDIVMDPRVIIQEGKLGTVRITSPDGSLHELMLLVKDEGTLEGRPMASVTLSLMEGRESGVAPPELVTVAEPSIWLPSDGFSNQPALVSVGGAKEDSGIDVAVNLRHLSTQNLNALKEDLQAEDCPEHQTNVYGDADEIGDDDQNCCSKKCPDGSGNEMTCCLEGPGTCCGCGVCCSP